ncbi:hypothetical protein CN198_34620 [Sinorhizobium meliloti]|nr:hypothetical protein CN198_34620 [Sinorhizobium meliloti]RVH99863.1 hypothetical protein CN205_34725 [Sinorhizobium meliloti]RVK58328.1 hypothetical protein CN159_34795 [Sinorhizobium meliloti]
MRLPSSRITAFFGIGGGPFDLCFIAFLEAADGTRKPSPPRMLAMTFMRLWKCISFFDGEPRHLSSMQAVTG